MGRLTNSSRDARRRANYVEAQRRFVQMIVDYDKPGPIVEYDDGLARAVPGEQAARSRAFLAEVESGATVKVAGWQVDLKWPEVNQDFLLDVNGRLTPVDTEQKESTQ